MTLEPLADVDKARFIDLRDSQLGPMAFRLRSISRRLTVATRGQRMGHLERALAALVSGDMDQVVVETQYADGPERFLGGIAQDLRAKFGDAAGSWLHLPNLALHGQSPREFMQIGDPGTWIIIKRLTSRRIPGLTKMQDRYPGRGHGGQ